MTVVLLSGASGFVGRQIANALVDEYDVELHAVGRRTVEILPSIRFHKADLLDEIAVDAVLRAVRAEVLVHAAWYVEHGEFWTAPVNRRWLASGRLLAKSFYREGGRRVVALGSMAEYNWTSNQPMIETTTPLAPGTLYGRCKRDMFQALQRIASEWEGEFAWARLFNLYGEYEDPRRFVPYIIRSLLAGEQARCTHGRQVRDYLNVREVGRAIAALALSPVRGPVNIASGVAVTQAEVAEMLAKMCRASHLLALGAVPAPADEPAELLADVNRLSQEVGFQPLTTLEQGLANAVAYWQRAVGMPAVVPR